MTYAELTATQRDVLYAVAALDQNGASAPKRIQTFYERELTLVSQSRLSSILSELTDRGLLSRKRSESDGRRWLYFTTKAGRQALVGEIRQRAEWIGMDIGEPTLAGQAIQPREVGSLESD